MTMNAFFSRTISSPRIALLLCVLAAVLGMGLVTYATSAGPGVGGDATIYLTTARNFLHGQGLGWIDADGSFRLLPYSGPLYPLVLSAVGLLTPDLTSGARWLNVILAGLTALLLGWGFYRITRQAWLAGLLAGLLAASPVLLGVQVWAMTEPLFLLTGFAGLLLLLEYLADPRPRWLVLSALLVSLACLTRYAGLAFVGTAGLALLLWAPGPTRQRWIRAIGYGLLAILPVLIWLVIDFAITGTVSSRSSQPASAYWQRFLAMCPALEPIYLFWLLPDSLIARLPGVIRTALWVIPTLAVAGLVVWLVRRATPPPAPPLQEGRGASGRGGSRTAPAVRLAMMMGLLIGVYLIVLTVVHVFVYPPVTLAARMLSPVHLAVLVLLAALAHLTLCALADKVTVGSASSAGDRSIGLRTLLPGLRPLLPGQRPLLPALIALTLLAIFGSYAARSALIARDYHRTGIGYNAAAWRDAPILEAVRRLPPEAALISNETTALMYLVDRPAYALQEIYQETPLAEFSGYGAGADDAQRAFREQGAALVLFNANLREDFAMYGDRLDERLAALTAGLRPVYQGEDGAIYFYR